MLLVVDDQTTGESWNEKCSWGAEAYKPSDYDYCMAQHLGSTRQDKILYISANGSHCHTTKMLE